MKKFISNNFFYIIMVTFFTILMYWIVVLGTKLENGRKIIIPSNANTSWQEFLNSIAHNVKHPLAILIAQIITIIIVARLFGWLCRRIGQPSVIGEIIAGIVLGPSLFGLYFPDLSASLFPASSLGNLQFLSQIGLILFMFVIGMELDFKILKNKAYDALIISHASIVIPFTLGIALAYFVYTSFAPEGVQFLSFSLFLGIAMSITAFPVLARIVQERGLHKTKLGTMVITCAAADDITAWCLLAAVIAIVKAGTFVSSLYIIGLSLIYVCIMIFIVGPFLGRIGNLFHTKESLSKPYVAIFFLTLMLSSYATEIIGIHALFGAFMAGAIMPDNHKFRAIFIEKVEDVALVLLLPLFFVFTGLRTEIGLLNDFYLWQVTAMIIFVAVAGKFLGSALASKIVGQNWKDSLTIGALMNTRGLMELVVLNIGYDLGILTPEIFAMMVIMALFTTFMTGPALDFINYLLPDKKQTKPEILPVSAGYRVLISFGNHERGKTLLRLANSLVKKMKDNALVTTLHLAPTNQLNQHNTAEYEKESFLPILSESEILKQKIKKVFKVSKDFDSDITEVANEGNYDLLLVGVGQSIYEGSLLGKILGFTSRIINPENLLNQVTGKENLFDNSPFDERTRNIINKSKTSVGVLLDKDFSNARNVFLPVFNESDLFLLSFAKKMIENADSKVTILDVSNQIDQSTDFKNEIEILNQTKPESIILQYNHTIDKEFLDKQNLMIISLESWKKLVETKSIWLSDVPSTLIVRDRVQ